jgi:hypothetical protein
MRIFKHRIFNNWAKSEAIRDEKLKEAISEIERGLYEASLGSSLYKKRVSMPGKGKRGSYRTLLAYKKEQSAFFIYGFAKNALDNISDTEKRVYRQLSEDLLNMNAGVIQTMLVNGKLFEVK